MNPHGKERASLPPSAGPRASIVLMGIVGVISLLSVGCASLALHPETPLPQHALTATEPGLIRTASAEAYHFALQAMMAERNGDVKRAIENYLAAIARDKESVFLHARLAELLIREGQVHEAMGYANTALSLEPNHLMTLLLMGGALASAGEPKKAITYIETARQVAPDRLETYYNLSMLYAGLQQYDDAERVIQMVIARVPKLPVGYYYLGQIAAQAGDVKRARKAYEHARQLDIGFVHATLALGELYEQQGETVKAIRLFEEYRSQGVRRQREVSNRLVQLYLQRKAYRKALAVLEPMLEKRPRDLETRLRRGLIFVDLHEFGKAIDDLLVVSAARPHDQRLHSYLAALYEEIKDYEQAITSYERVVELMPKNPDALIRLGSLHGRRHETEKALAYIERARAIDDQRIDLYLVMGYIYFESEQYEEAVQSFTDGIAVDPNDAELHFNLGAVYDKLDRFDDMKAQMDVVLEIDPNHANAMNYIGYTYAERGIRLHEAVELIKRALSVKPNEGAFVDSLGWAYYKLGKTEEALEKLERAIELMPDDPIIQEHLGEVYLKTQRRQEARDAWSRALELDPDNEELRKRFEESGFDEEPDQAPPPVPEATDPKEAVARSPATEL